MKNVVIVILSVLSVNLFAQDFSGPDLICKDETVTYTATEPGFVDWRKIEIFDLSGTKIEQGGSTFILDYSDHLAPKITNHGLEGTYTVKRQVRYCNRKVAGICVDYNIITNEIETTFEYGLTGTDAILSDESICADNSVNLTLVPDEDATHTTWDNTGGSNTGDLSTYKYDNLNWRLDFGRDAGGTYTVRVHRSIIHYSPWKSCSADYLYKTITVTPLLDAPPTPTGSSSVCQGSSSTYTIAAIGGATQYDWEMSPASAGTLTESGRSATINFSSSFYGSATIRVRARNCGWSDFSPTRSITVTQLPAKATTPSGSTVVCQGSQNVEYTTSATRATSYTFSISPSNAGTVSVSGSTAYVDFSSSFTGTATLYSRGVNCGSGPQSSGRTITVNPLPGSAGTPTGNTSVCMAASGVTYNTSGATNASSYTWQLTPSGAGSVTGTGTTGTVTFAEDFSGTASLRVRGESCGSGTWSSYLTINVADALGTPVTPTGDVEICQNASNTTYSTSSLSGASSYVWEISPTEAGLISGTGTTGTVDWSSSFSGAVTVRVRGVNGCGSSPWSSTLGIDVAPLPGTCTQPTGATSRCQGTGTTNYTVTALGNATSYEWELTPTGAGTISGTTNTGTIAWSSDFTGTATVRVRGVNGCGNGIWSTGLSVTVNPIAGKAATPVGAVTACQGTQDINYSTTGAANATSYQWEISPVTAGTITPNGVNAELDLASSFNGNVTIHVRGISCTYGAWSDDLVLSVAASIGSASTPTGETELCQDAINTNYTATEIANAASYEWSISPSEAGIISGTGTTGTVNWSSSFSGSATIQVRGVNGCGTSSWSSPLDITISPLPGICSLPSGSTTVCQGTSSTSYTTSGATNSSSYEWELLPTGAGTITGSGTTASLNWNASYTGTATIRVRGVNDCGNGDWSSSLQIAVNPLPGKAGTPIGSSSLCQGSTGISYTTSGATYATSYEWELLPVEAGSLIENSTSITLNLSESYTGSASLRVRGVSCGNGEWSDEFSITVNASIGSPNTPSGEVELCQDAANSTYTVSEIANSTSYIWELSPLDAGIISGTTTSATVNWSSSYAGNASITVQGVNGCGSSEVSSPLNIVISPLPGTCSMPTGSSTICQGTTSTSYSTTGATNSSSYEWELLPTGAGTITGSGTTASLNWNASFTGTATIRVRGVNDCGNGDWSGTLQITVNPLPGKAGTPIGTSYTCQGSTGLSYSTSGADFATGYQWDLSPTDAGTLIQNGTLATLNLTESFTGTATLKVRGVSCGSGAWSDELSLTVSSTIDSATTPIGEVELCQDAANTTYTVNPIGHAESYQWSISPSSAGMISGTGTTGTVNWSSTFSDTAYISVRGINSCGNSNWSIPLSVGISPLPGSSPTPTGSTSICQGTSSVSYTCTGTLNADSYQWQLSPTDAGTISGTGTTATANFNSSFTGTVTIRARGVNDCGNGSWSSNLQVLINPLPNKASTPIGSSSVCQGSSGVVYNTLGANFASSYDWEISPTTAGTLTENGTSVTVNFSSDFTGDAVLKVRGVSCGNGEWSDDFQITIIPNLGKPTQPIGDVEICQNAPNTSYATLKITSATSYEWSILPSDAGIIINYGDTCSVNWGSSFTGDATLNVRAYNACGYSVWSDDLDIEVAPLPEKSTIPTGPSYLCQGGEVQLHVDSIENASSYQWEISPENAYSFNSDSTRNNVSILINGEYSGRIYYKVYGKNSCGLGEVSQNIFLDVLESPVTPELTIDSVNCFGDDINLFVTNNFGSYNTKWYDSEEDLISTGDNVSFTVDENTKVIFVQYNSTNGCSSVLQKLSMNVPPKIVAGFSTPINVIKNGEAITFLNESSSNAHSYLWEFGDGLNSKDESPVHSYFNSGEYSVKLTAYDEFGCLSIIEKEDLITVNKNGVLSVDNNVKVLGIDVYPNPSDGFFNVDTKHYNFDNDIEVIIFNSVGQIVYTDKLNSGTIETVDLSDSTPGIYLIQFMVNGFTSSKKLVIE